ncbi:methyl-accepting chemotaxis protein [Phenylobacterium montanum]|uniref:PAS domain S-box protein n=1 Tax=Phenylobacterium montanum TaxID=2823693 RepID=A0A975G473_9CAUL|nr:PAS domain-containing methyl-accepting chemotaxis protein [Caulobacter sp. S6]QUD89711.1 PAS domain S-box protein [Caulobacter sp. S6]
MSLFGGARAPDARSVERISELEAMVAAINRSQAVIEFELDGTIVDANENFLKTMGYALSEVKGRRHSMFVSPEYADSAEYRAFWRQLGEGRFFVDKFQRVGKGGREVWIQGAYNPVLDKAGRPYKVVKFATDITQAELERAAREAGRESEEQMNTVVTAMAEGLQRLADGDLTARIDADFAGRYRRMREDFNRATESLREAVIGISQASDGLRTGADEIAGASDDLSRRTEQQAASLEETAAALDEITATVKRSADGAKAATAAASEAKADATRSGQVMGDAIAAMSEIEESSGKVTQIIGVIDEIAFQTNLLALNAGVEAARAGDAGRGFAVVAQEVRALAQRSAEAAKEIKALIASSSDQVQRGVKLVGDTGEALGGIAVKVSRIDTLIAEIAQSSQEQAVGLSQVNTAINQMDQVTQQNAAMVEEATAAAASLKGEAAALAELVGRFKAGQSPGAGRMELARAGRHAPVRSPVAQAQARIAASVRGASNGDWQES